MTMLCISLPPLRASRQVEDNLVHPSIDNFEREPGRQPGVLLLPLHSTLMPPKSLEITDATRTLIISLPPINQTLKCALLAYGRKRTLTAFRLARGSILTPVVLRSGTILLRKDTMEALLCTVRTWWSTPSPPTAGTMVGTFDYLCAPKPWSSTSPTTVVGILGGTSGDPCVIDQAC